MMKASMVGIKHDTVGGRMKKILLVSFFVVILFVEVQSVAAVNIPEKVNMDGVFFGKATVIVSVDEYTVHQKNHNPVVGADVRMKFSFFHGPVLGYFPLWGYLFGDQGKTDSNGQCILTVLVPEYLLLHNSSLFSIFVFHEYLGGKYGYVSVDVGSTQQVTLTYVIP
jgi:hypothetical protein